MFLFSSPVQKIVRSWKRIVVAGCIVGGVLFLLTFAFPLSYRADADILVMATSRFGADPYTVVRSAERIGEHMAAVIGTSDFYAKVKEESGRGVDWTSFDAMIERKRRRAWDKTVASSMIFGTNILHVSAFHKDRGQAEQLAGVIAATVATKGWEYVGNDVSFKIINSPIATRFPVRPNPLLNGLLGFLLGIVIAGFLVGRR